MLNEEELYQVRDEIKQRCFKCDLFGKKYKLPILTGFDVLSDEEINELLWFRSNLNIVENGENMILDSINNMYYDWGDKESFYYHRDITKEVNIQGIALTLENDISLLCDGECVPQHGFSIMVVNRTSIGVEWGHDYLSLHDSFINDDIHEEVLQAKNNPKTSKKSSTYGRQQPTGFKQAWLDLKYRLADLKKTNPKEYKRLIIKKGLTAIIALIVGVVVFCILCL